MPSIVQGLKNIPMGGGLGTAMAGLTAALVAEPVIDDIGDILRTRYTDINSPVWKAMGSSQLYGDYSSLAEFESRARALLDLKYGKPVDVAGEVASEAVKGIGKSLKDTMGEYKTMRAFDAIENSPQVRALGREKAQQIYNQVSALAPNIMRKAPNVALSIMNDAIMTDSTALRPETAMALARSASELSKMQ